MAAALTQAANDKQQLVPMPKNLGREPERASADAGYFSEAAITDEKLAGIELLMPPYRQKHSGGSQPGQVTAEIDTPVAAAAQD